jgi:hypothetical protein
MSRPSEALKPQYLSASPCARPRSSKSSRAKSWWPWVLPVPPRSRAVTSSVRMPIAGSAPVSWPKMKATITSRFPLYRPVRLTRPRSMRQPSRNSLTGRAPPARPPRAAPPRVSGPWSWARSPGPMCGRLPSSASANRAARPPHPGAPTHLASGARGPPGKEQACFC